MITTNKQIVLDKLSEGWKLQSSPYYGAPVWLSRGKGDYQDPYQTIPVRRSTLNALLKQGLIKYNFTDNVYLLIEQAPGRRRKWKS